MQNSPLEQLAETIPCILNTFTLSPLGPPALSDVFAWWSLVMAIEISWRHIIPPRFL
jgi:hypothetical protein